MVRTALVALLAGTCALAAPLAPAHAAQTAAAIPSPKLVALPATAVRGTVLLIHGGGWQGPGPIAQRGLMQHPGDMFLARGWRVVSVDYRAGLDGVEDVVAAARAELAAPEGGPLCVYGESAGAQLALVAAARVSGIDCVMAAGAPTDLLAYQREAAASADVDRGVVAGTIATLFGSSSEAVAPWDPVALAPTISADILLLRQDDDAFVPREQLDRFLAVVPTAQHVDLAAAAESSDATRWLHGTISDAGRTAYLGALGSFADRAVAAARADATAEASVCARRHPLATAPNEGLASALRCLARRVAAVRATLANEAVTTTRRLRGKVNAARLWASLLASRRGRCALAAIAAGRATISVRPGDPTGVTIRIARREHRA